jgi:hypothetical protein
MVGIIPAFDLFPAQLVTDLAQTIAADKMPSQFTQVAACGGNFHGGVLT